MKFFSCTNHISGVQYLHKTRGYHFRQHRARLFSSLQKTLSGNPAPKHKTCQVSLEPQFKLAHLM